MRLEHIGTIDEIQLIAMQRVEGMPGDSWIRKRPPEVEVERFLKGLFDALRHLHRRDLVVGDVSPGAVIVKEGGDPVLLPFGTAGILADVKGETPNSVRDYAPTSAAVTGVFDQAADVFGVAALGFRAATGKRAKSEAGSLRARAELEEDLRSAGMIQLSKTLPGLLEGAARGDSESPCATETFE